MGFDLTPQLPLGAYEHTVNKHMENNLNEFLKHHQYMIAENRHNRRSSENFVVTEFFAILHVVFIPKKQSFAVFTWL